MFDDFGADPLFGLKFYGRHEEVVEEAPFGFVEVVEEGDDSRIFEASVAEPLADMSPVFTFDVSIVVFVIGAGASELDRYFSVEEIAHEGLIEEFIAVVRVKAENGKR